MKAYIDANGKIRMFRPDMNMKRLLRSAARLNFPSFDSNQFMECVKELIRIDKSWIPKEDGYSLYIRPTYIATHPFLGICLSYFFGKYLRRCSSMFNKALYYFIPCRTLLSRRF